MKRSSPIWLVLLALSAGAHEPPAETAVRTLSELRCLACHVPSAEVAARVQPRPAVSLENAGARWAPEAMRALLEHGHAPDLLHALAPAERARAADALARFLASLGGPLDVRETTALPHGLERGRSLYHEIGCIACHGPQEEAWELEQPFFAASAAPEADEEFEPPVRIAPTTPIAPPGELAAKTSVEGLTRYLLDPLAAGGRMPALHLDREEARAIALYLLREQALGDGAGPAYRPGLSVAYYEATFEQPAPDFDALTPTRHGVVATIDGLPPHRADHFGFRFEGWLAIDVAGAYTFSTTSDDGSRLYVNGQLVVQNDGFHAMVRAEGTLVLEPGRHAIEVTMFERDGSEGLEVLWKGPDFEERLLDPERLTHTALVYRAPGPQGFAPDAAAIAEGRRLFGALDCAACHSIGGQLRPAPRARPLAALDPTAAGGCFDARPEAGRPRYELAAGEREALRSALGRIDELARPVSSAERLATLLERNACTACHARGAAGGPPREYWPYFQTRGHAELGDEGRIPPPLDEVGNKLRPDALRAVLLEGATARPYMATRMPRYDEAEAAEIAALLIEVDARPLTPVPEFTPEAVADGRRLVGIRGLGCIQCHDFAGHESLGVPAVDLAKVHSRLNYDWFARLLDDPISLNMNTRMPEFWVGGRSPVADVLDGDPARQIAAMWSYLSLGDSMPLPEGLVVADEVYELLPIDRPITCGVFMAGVSPRTLAVGFPENVHYAFDLQRSRLAKVWRGRFLNARGTWEGRAGALESPPAEVVLDLPPGPAIAQLDTAHAPWPNDISPRARGRTTGVDGTLAFHYSLGDVEVSETLRPVLRKGGSNLVRQLDVVAGYPRPKLYFRAALGERITPTGAGAWTILGAVPQRVLHIQTELDPSAAGARFYVSHRDGQAELRVELGPWSPAEGALLTGSASGIAVELSW